MGILDTKTYLVRSRDAGVFFGHIESKEGSTVVMRNARRVWYWSGAASLSELAERGSSDPTKCKIPCAVKRIEVRGVCEVAEMSDVAVASLALAPEWSLHDGD